MHRRLASGMVLTAVALVLAACGSPERTAEREAREDADARAHDLENPLSRAAQDSRFATHVAALAIPGRDGVELLRAVGEGDGETYIDVRVTGHVDAHTSQGIGDSTYPEATVERCYRFTLESWGATMGSSGDCDDEDREAPALVPEPVIGLDGDDLEALRVALTESPDPTSTLEQQLPEGVALDVGVVDGWTGVAVRAPAPGRDCLLGRRSTDGEVEVWSPPAILVAPGESSCSAETAATGGARTSPH